jgi:hypothetical protein
MSEKFYLELAAIIVAALGCVGILWNKKSGWEPRPVRATIIALAVPAIFVLRLEDVLNNLGMAAMLTALAGAGVVSRFRHRRGL